MTKQKALLWLIAISQFALGALIIIIPQQFFLMMGLSSPPLDNNYMLGMLGARFLAYGTGMVMLARQPTPNLFWIRNMIFVQLVDFAVGAFYLFSGVIGLSVVAFPMFNAALFSTLLWFWFPNRIAA
ncbi:hypothetical protein [Maritalea sp.]|jgi:hypothetical protein|uniref:hypothetical protein n=1 Tax=Maritalea sp. TaxID=2003361 RepID=UPI0039E5AB58